MMWKKISRTENENGRKIVYELDRSNIYGTSITIESKQKLVPRVNGKGMYFKPSYTICEDGRPVKEFDLLVLAKKWAEEVTLPFWSR